MNSFVAKYRTQFPDDPRSDEELTWEFGLRLFQTPENVERAKTQDPDFYAQYERIKQTRAQALKPAISEEFGRGLAAGGRSLASTAAGAGALAADAIPGTFADPLRDKLSQVARDQEARAAELQAPSKVEDVAGVEDAVRLGLYASGNVLPSLLEAIGLTAVGAVAGSAAAPGPGTVGGAVTGLVGRQAVKSLLRKGIADATAAQIKTEAKAIAAKYGAGIAGALNSYALSSGEIYNDLTARGVDPDMAFNTSLVGGLVAAIPDTILPAYIVGKFFPGVPKTEVHRYMTRLAREAALTIPAEAVTEGFQELVNIASARYADPTLRESPLSADDYSRILNASVFGAVGGGLAGPVAAIPGGGRQTATPPTPTPTGVNPSRREELYHLAVSTAGDTAREQAIIAGLSPQERTAYLSIRSNIPTGGEIPGVTTPLAGPEPPRPPPPPTPLAPERSVGCVS